MLLIEKVFGVPFGWFTDSNLDRQWLIQNTKNACWQMCAYTVYFNILNTFKRMLINSTSTYGIEFNSVVLVHVTSTKQHMYAAYGIVEYTITISIYKLKLWWMYRLWTELYIYCICYTYTCTVYVAYISVGCPLVAIHHCFWQFFFWLQQCHLVLLYIWIHYRG